MSSQAHQPVLLDEVIAGLAIDGAGFYIDGTFGRGGHSRALLPLLTTGQLLVIDKDPEAIAAAQLLAQQQPKLTVEQGSFAHLAGWVGARNWQGQVAGILLDLGVSSPQLDNAERGFSFSKKGPLDMRMDPKQGQSAQQWIAQVDEESLANVFWRYGEERFSRRIAKAIVNARKEQCIDNTEQLAAVIARTHPRWSRNKHPATRCFQAIRIFINDELRDLQEGLVAGLQVLRAGGRLAVITFHSLEEQIVKQFVRPKNAASDLPRDLPIVATELAQPAKLLSKIKPSAHELALNPRSRSSKLWVIEKQ